MQVKIKLYLHIGWLGCSDRTRFKVVEVMSSLRKEVLKAGLPPLPTGDFRSNAGVRKRRQRNYSPLPWNNFFDKSEDVTTSANNCFHVYSRGSSGPVLLLLHGGGHSALSWALFAVEVTKLVNCQIVAMDIRGHGCSKTVDDGDLSAKTLVNDVSELVGSLFPDEVPPIVIMGHSMGGAIAVRVAAEQIVPTLIGLIIIDVVEGTAVESLASMQSFLRGRPSTFNSLEHAIEWSIRSGQLRNPESARVSMPGQLAQCSASTSSGSTTKATSTTQYNIMQQPILEETISDTKTETEQKGELITDDKSSAAESLVYTWRIDLTKTEKFWHGWFQGLTELFMSVPVAKLLILAGVDRLDKVLTIGQMQGKFQMEVFAGCGHTVHEDAPNKVADTVSNFLIRHKFAVRTLTS